MSGGTNLPGYGNLVLPLTGTQILAHFLGTIELTVTSLANPTELNAVGSDVPDWRLCKTVGAGTDDATLYRLDASSASVNAPYVMASATAGLRWVAIAGAYVNQEMAINGGVNLPSETASRVVTTDSNKDLDTPATVTTGQAWAFTSTVTVVDGGFSITGSSDATKTIKFEVDAQTAGDTLTINSGAQTDSRTLTVPVLTGNATLTTLEETQTLTGTKTFSAVTTVSNATASSSTTTGALVVTGGVGIGGAANINGVAITDTSTYGVVALNGVTSPLANTIGIYGAGSGDDALYLNALSGASIQFRVNNAQVFAIESTQATVSAAAVFLVPNVTDATTVSAGAAVVTGGLAVGKRICLDGDAGKTLKIVNGVANAAVAVVLGGVGPTGSTAGNPQGWMRIDVNGTDRYIPYW